MNVVDNQFIPTDNPTKKRTSSRARHPQINDVIYLTSNILNNVHPGFGNPMKL